jgi:hypothetical protein
MNKYLCICALFFCIACAPAVTMKLPQDATPSDVATSSPEIASNKSDSSGNRSDLSAYYQGYNDGLIFARSESYNGCLAGGCLLGSASVIAGFFTPAVFGISLAGSPVQMYTVSGGIVAGMGSIYLVNQIAGVSAPDPIAGDSLYQKGVVDGYRRSFKSRRLNESLKGSAIGVGTTCIGISVLALLAWLAFWNIFNID